MQAIERLEHIEALKQLKARYCRCVDTCDWDGFAALLAQDVVVDVRAGMSVDHTAADDEFTDNGYQVGRDKIVAWVKEHGEGIEATVHQCHTPELELTSETSARGIWAMEDWVHFSHGGPIKSLHGYGHYHETYVLERGVWLFKSVRLTRLRVDLTKNV